MFPIRNKILQASKVKEVALDLVPGKLWQWPCFGGGLIKKQNFLRVIEKSKFKRLIQVPLERIVKL